MELTLTHLRVLLAAILLIAGSTLASAAPCLTGGALGASVESSVSRDRMAALQAGLDQEILSSAASDHDDDQNGCMEDCSMKCVGSSASGCCAAAVPIGGCSALDRASIAACGITDIGFLATGIDPDALLRPPRSYV